MSIDRETARAALQARKDELLALHEDSAQSRETVELDQSRVGRLSRMDALQGAAMADASAARRKQALRRIQAALSRLEQGEYGHCLECDCEIPTGRLQIDPAAEHCVHCAAS